MAAPQSMSTLQRGRPVSHGSLLHVVTHSTLRWRATLVGITYALTYVGFGAPLLFARIAREVTSAEAMGVFAAAALVTAWTNRGRA